MTSYTHAQRGGPAHVGHLLAPIAVVTTVVASVATPWAAREILRTLVPLPADLAPDGGDGRAEPVVPLTRGVERGLS